MTQPRSIRSLSVVALIIAALAAPFPASADATAAPVTVSVDAAIVYGTEQVYLTARVDPSSPGGDVTPAVDGVVTQTSAWVGPGGSRRFSFATPMGSSQVTVTYVPSAGASYTTAPLTIQRRAHLYTQPIVDAAAGGLLGESIPKSIRFSKAVMSGSEGGKFRTIGPPAIDGYPWDWVVDALFHEWPGRYGWASSCPVTIRVDQQRARLHLSAGNDPIVMGRPAMLNIRATVDGAPVTLPAGTKVELLQGDSWRPAVIATTTLSDGEGTFSRTWEPPGPVRLTARFQPEEWFSDPQSDPLIVEVTRGSAPGPFTSPPGSAATAVTLSSTQNPNVRGDPVGIIATVEPNPGSGSVWFYEGRESLGFVPLDASGRARLDYWRADGEHEITAVFGSTSGQWASSARSITQTTLPRMSTVTVTAPTSRSLGREPVTLKATISPKPPEGGQVVEFLGLGQAAVDRDTGEATFITSSLLPGTHLLRARFDGSATLSPSVSPPLTHEVTRRSTTLEFVPRPESQGGGITTNVKLIPDPSAPYQRPQFEELRYELMVDGRVVAHESQTGFDFVLLGAEFNPGTYPVQASFLGSPHLEPSMTPASTVQIGDRNQPPLPLFGAAWIAPDDVATSDGLVDVNVTVDPASGPVSHVQLSNDGTTWATFEYRDTPMVIPWSITEATCGGTNQEGSHDVFVRWVRTHFYNDDAGVALASDAVTLTSEVRTATSLVDRTAPSLTPPIVALLSGGSVPLSSVRLDIRWSGEDALSGIRRYEVTDNDGSTLRDLPLAIPTATVVTALVAPGTNHTYTVGALDRAGNETDASSRTVQVRDFSDKASAIKYGGAWRSASISDARGGTVRTTKERRASASLSFTGSSVGWVAPTGPGRGRVKVYLDDVYIATVDLGNSTRLPRRLVFSREVSFGAHVLRLVARGTAGRPLVELDSIIVLR